MVFEGKIALYLISGGIVYLQTTCFIGEDLVLDIPILFQEMVVPNVTDCLKISRIIHLNFPYHKSLDEPLEKLKRLLN